MKSLLIALTLVAANLAHAGLPNFVPPNPELIKARIAHCEKMAATIVANYTNQVFTDELSAQIKAESQGIRVRVFHTNDAVTADYSSSRLNVLLSVENVVLKSFCQ